MVVLGDVSSSPVANRKRSVHVDEGNDDTTGGDDVANPRKKLRLRQRPDCVDIGGTDLPLLQSYTCHPAVRPHVHKAARQALSVVEKSNEIRNPTTKSIKHPDLITTTMVYAKFEALEVDDYYHSNPSFDYVHETYDSASNKDKDSMTAEWNTFYNLGELNHIGMTHSVHKRYNDLRGIFEICRIDSLGATTNQELGKIWLDLISKIIDTPTAPIELRSFFPVIRDDGGHCLGFKKKSITHLIEIGAQLKWMPSDAVAEGFMCDDNVLRARKERVLRAIEQVKPLLEKYKGRKLRKSMLSWKTGAAEHKQSSYVKTMEYVVGVGNWENALEDAAFPNAVTGEEIFNNTSYTEDQVQVGRQRVMDAIQSTIDEESIFILDRNESPLFPNAELEKNILPGFWFFPIARIFGNRVIVFAHDESGGLVILIRPFCRASDSSSYARLVLSIFCAMAVEAVKGIVDFLKGAPSSHEQASLMTSSHNAIVVSAFYEMTIVGQHMGKRVAAAMFRHQLAMDGSNSCVDNDLRKTPDDLSYPIANTQRSVETGRTVKDDARPVDHYMIEKGLTMLLTFSPTSMDLLLPLVKRIHQWFQSDGVDSRAVCKRWEHLIANIHFVSLLAQWVVQTRNGMKHNKGNTDPRVDFVLSSTDADFARILELNGQSFWVREKGSKNEAENAAAKALRPEDPDPHPVIVELAYEGVRTRIKPKVPKGSTKAQLSIKAPDKNIRIVPPSRRSNGYVLCHLVDKGQK